MGTNANQCTEIVIVIVGESFLILNKGCIYLCKQMVYVMEFK